MASRRAQQSRFLSVALAGSVAFAALWHADDINRIASEWLGASQDEDALAGIDSRATPAFRAATLASVPPKFSFEQTWSFPNNTQALAVGDFNGDGRNDLAAVAASRPPDAGYSAVFLFHQKPNGTFDAPVIIEFPVEMYLGAVGPLTAADLNEDGRSDLVIAQRQFAAIHYMVSEPGGGFAWRQDDWSNLFSQSTIHAADMDGDGHIDLVGHLQSQYDPQNIFAIPAAQVATYFGDGTGSFPRHSSDVSVELYPPTALGQLDADGRADYLSQMGYPDKRPRVRMNDGAGGWKPSFALGARSDEEIRGLAVADLTGDGRQDAVSISNTSPSRIVIYPQLPDGSLAKAALVYPAGGYSSLLRSADLNGDGRPDLVQLDEGSSIPRFLYYLPDAYGLGYPIAHDFDVGSNPAQFLPRDMVAGDLNGDGVTDVAVATALHGLMVLSGKLTPVNGPIVLPGAPTLQSIQAIPGEDPLREVDVTVGAPADDGGSPIIGYNVYSVPGDVIDADAGSPNALHRMIGLKNNQAYTFYARAINAAGLGPASPMSAPVVLGVPVDPDSPPTIFPFASPLQETDVGSTLNEVTVYMDKPAPAGGSSFRISTSNGTAQAGLDYVPLNNVLVTIPEGATTLVMPFIEVLGDFLVEGTEALNLNFSDLQNVSFESLQFELTIQEYEPAEPYVSIGHVQVLEGNAGTTVLNIPVKLSKALATDVTFDFATSSADATAGVDYQELLLTGQTIAAGQASANMQLTVMGDTQHEFDEAIFLYLYNIEGATGGNLFAQATIVDDDGAPTLSVADVSVLEGDQTATAARFRVSLSGPSPKDVFFSATTMDGSAIAGSDYVSRYVGNVIIKAGQLSADVVIAVQPDTQLEPDETFSLRLEGVKNVQVGDATAVATIINNDVPNGIAVDDLSVTEGGIARFSIRLSETSAQPVTFDAWTSPGTAAPDIDYQSTQGNALVIPAGQTVATFSVPTLQDGLVEDNETFVVNLSNVSGAIVTDAQGLGRIVNNDAAVLSISDAAPVLEGNSAATMALFEIRLSHPLPTAVLFDVYLPGVGTADGYDYGAPYRVAVRIDPGRTRVVYPVYVIGDTVAEPDETFQVKITAVKGALLGDDIGVGTIINDDGAGVKGGRSFALKQQARFSIKRSH